MAKKLNLRSMSYPGIVIRFVDMERDEVMYENKDGYVFEKFIFYGKRNHSSYFMHNGKRIYLETFEPRLR